MGGAAGASPAAQQLVTTTLQKGNSNAVSNANHASSNAPQTPPPLIVEVLRVTHLTPRMVRVTFGGEQLAGFDSKGPAEHFRLFLPDSETGELALPIHGPDGNEFPEGAPRPISRAYTPRRWDPQTPELDMDIALHDNGPGSTWARSVREGNVAVISSHAGGAYFPDLNVDWYVIGGDESALPAIGTVLEALPPTMRADVIIEVHDDQEELTLRSPASLEAQWLHRKPEEAPCQALVQAMRTVTLPEGNGRVWVSCEATAMREIRRSFIEERGIDRSMLRTQGYWKAGATNHPDHDMGDDV